jgi:ATP-dependent DNA ligase
MDDDYQNNLLRTLIGYFHISVTQQIALTRHGKAFEHLTQAEKDALQNEVIQAVMAIARDLTAETLQNFLKPPPTPAPPGPVN